jgi:hypothetical protein
VVPCSTDLELCQQTRMLESERIAQRNMVAAFQKEHHETVQALRDARQQVHYLILDE